MVSPGNRGGPWDIGKLKEPPAYRWGQIERLPEYDLKELADVVRAISLAASLPEVEATKIGVMGTYADSRIRGGKPLPTIRGTGEEEDGTVWFEFETSSGFRWAELIYAADEAPSPASVWERLPAVVRSDENRRAACRLPAGAKTYFFTLEDEEGNTVSTEVRETKRRTDQ